MLKRKLKQQLHVHAITRAQLKISSRAWIPPEFLAFNSEDLIGKRTIDGVMM